MQLGCGEWGFRNLPMQRHFEIAADFEFRELEFGIGGGQPGRLPDQMTREDARQFQELARSFDIQTSYCCLENDFTSSDRSIHERQVQVTLEQLRWAAECGARFVRLFAGWTPAEGMTEEIWKRMFAAFEACQKECEKLSLTIAIETHGVIREINGVAHHIHSVTTRRDCLERLLRELPEQIGFNYDPGNLKPFAPGDPDLFVDLLNGRIQYCHLKDWRRVGDGWVACAPGDDDLDYGALLPRIEFDGVYFIEYEPLEDTIDGIRRSLDYLNQFQGTCC